MIIKNRWKAILDAKGVTQAQIAEITGQTKPFISGVVNGVSVLSADDLDKVCEAIGTTAGAIYPDEVLSGIYGSATEKKERQIVLNVKLRGEAARLLSELRERHGYETNVDTVTIALRRMNEQDAMYGRNV